MMMKTENLALLIQVARRPDLQNVDGVVLARKSFENGDLDGAIDALSTLKNAKDVVGSKAFAVIEAHYAKKIAGVIASGIKHEGFSVLVTEAGYSYTVGLAKDKPELFVVHSDLSDDSSGIDLLKRIASMDYSAMDCIIHFEDGVSVLLTGTVGSPVPGAMSHADQWWGGQDYPVKRVTLTKGAVEKASTGSVTYPFASTQSLNGGV
jgi:hypothetical protein